MSRAHGTRARYVHGEGPGSGQGCRCAPCSEANRIYERDRDRAKRRPDVDSQVYFDNSEARDHLEFLRSQGVGLRTVAEASGVSRSALQKITNRDRLKSRQDTIDRILGVGTRYTKPGAYVPAGKTHRQIADLLRDGWTKVAIARAITGNSNALSLQLRETQVSSKNARAVDDLWRTHFYNKPERKQMRELTRKRRQDKKQLQP